MALNLCEIISRMFSLCWNTLFLLINSQMVTWAPDWMSLITGLTTNTFIPTIGFTGFYGIRRFGLCFFQRTGSSVTAHFQNAWGFRAEGLLEITRTTANQLPAFNTSLLSILFPHPHNVLVIRNYWMADFLIASFKKSTPLSIWNFYRTYLTLVRDKRIYAPEE